VAAHQKKTRRLRATLVFLDESGFSQRPSIRRTWSPKGQTPSLTQPFNWKRLSLIGALASAPGDRKVRLFLSIRSSNVNSLTIKEFLRSLRRHIRGHVVLIWDGLPSHRSTETQTFIAEQKHWLHVERLPAYAPELNPVEYLWAHLCATDLANFSADDLGALSNQITKGARRIRRHTDMGRAFLKHSGLFF
jgi:transposase